MFLSRILAAAVLGVASPAAAQVWNWHTLDVWAPETGRVEWIAHLRAKAHGADVVETQIGARACVRINPKLDWTAGYYYIWKQAPGDSWQTTQRPFTGPEVRIARPGPADIRFRSWVEGMVPEGQPWYVRFRERVQVCTRWAAGPVASAEVFFDTRNGWCETRYTAGVRWRMGPRVMAQAEYMYDQRPARLGGSRSIIQTLWNVSGAHKRF